MNLRLQTLRRSLYDVRLSSALPWTYVHSALAGRWNRAHYRDLRSFVLFIGNGRCGTSLLGSLLNAHCHVCIGHELNVLRYVARGYRRNQLLWLLVKQDAVFGQIGRRWTGYAYEVPNQWQGRFKQLLVLGDKKAGLTSTTLGERPELLQKLEDRIRLPLRIIHLVRHPQNVITTMHRKQGWSLEASADLFFQRCETNWRLMNERPKSIRTIHLEAFIAEPRRHLADLCQWMGVDPGKDYLRDAAGIVLQKPRQSWGEVLWPVDLLHSVERRAAAYPFLANYNVEAAA
jgi:hypothetical protein